MMVSSSNHSLAEVQGRLLVIGGYQETETTSKVEMLDMSSITCWEEGVELSTSRSALVSGVVTLGEELVVGSKVINTSPLHVLDRFTRSKKQDLFSVKRTIITLTRASLAWPGPPGLRGAGLTPGCWCCMWIYTWGSSCNTTPLQARHIRRLLQVPLISLEEGGSDPGRGWVEASML